MDTNWVELTEQIIGYVFKEKKLLEQALSHSSAVNRREDSNERLEFLGDAILGLIVCSRIFEQYPALEEGEMTKIKSVVVSRKTCAAIGKHLELPKVLRVGKGMMVSRDIPDSVIGAAYEAIIAAILLDGGFEASRIFVLNDIEEYIALAASSTHQENYKSVLQQVGLKQTGSPPIYVVLNEKGPDHEKCFEISAEIDGKQYPACLGASKKEAEQLAALAALVELDVATVNEDGSVVINFCQGE
tara:strand:+ start:275 stop:1006 length:732 start_codon:yes stop_codon:yes gene_type:complete